MFQLGSYEVPTMDQWLSWQPPGDQTKIAKHNKLHDESRKKFRAIFAQRQWQFRKSHHEFPFTAKNQIKRYSNFR
jgi:hypothetical protein